MCLISIAESSSRSKKKKWSKGKVKEHPRFGGEEAAAAAGKAEAKSKK
jgi:hypothetical protein